MSTGPGAGVLVGPAAVSWVVDADSIIVVTGQGREAHVLRGVEAAVWSWLSLSYPHPALVRLIAAQVAIPPADADRRLRAILGDWRARGLLEFAGPSRG